MDSVKPSKSRAFAPVLSSLSVWIVQHHQYIAMNEPGIHTSPEERERLLALMDWAEANAIYALEAFIDERIKKERKRRKKAKATRRRLRS